GKPVRGHDGPSVQESPWIVKAAVRPDFVGSMRPPLTTRSSSAATPRPVTAKFVGVERAAREAGELVPTRPAFSSASPEFMWQPRQNGWLATPLMLSSWGVVKNVKPAINALRSRGLAEGNTSALRSFSPRGKGPTTPYSARGIRSTGRN